MLLFNTVDFGLIISAEILISHDQIFENLGQTQLMLVK